MKIRTILGLSLVGTALYAHKRHGGEFSLDSFRESFKDLWKGIQNKAADAKDKAEELASEAKDKIKDAAQTAKPMVKDAAAFAQNKPKDPIGVAHATSKDDSTGFGSGNSGGYTPGTRH